MRRSWKRWAAVLAAVPLWGLDPGSARATEDLEFEVELGGGDALTLALPSTLLWARIGCGGLRVRQWNCHCADVDVTVIVEAYPRKSRFPMRDALEVAEGEAFTWRAHYTLEPWPDFEIATREDLEGKPGHVLSAALVTGPPGGATPAARERFVRGGVLAEHTYAVAVLVEGRAPPLVREALLDFLREGVRARARSRDPAWSPKEVRDRLEQDLPPDVVARMKPPVRTRHFILFTDTDAGVAFGRRLEAIHDAVRKTWALPDGNDGRLLPYYLFANAGDFRAFAARACPFAENVHLARGYAVGDWAATYLTTMADPVYLHEAAHQLFGARRRLWGGGSWFVEGVAQYAAMSAADREAFGREVAKGKPLVPLRELVSIRELIAGSDRISGRDAYRAAGSLMGFLKDGKWKHEAFPKFLEAMGRRPGEKDLAGTEGVFREVYGATIEEVEAAWRASFRAK